MGLVRIFIVTGLCILAGQAVLANAPSTSLHPKARPVGITSYVPHQTSVPVFYNAHIRPKPRPVTVTTVRYRGPSEVQPATQPTAQPTVQPTVQPEAAVFLRNVPGLQRSLRPKARPKNMRRIVARAKTAPIAVSGEVRGPRRGAVCGDRAIRGQAIARIRGRISACGIENPVKITSVDGVALSTPATLDCTTAKALKQWVHNGAKPAVGRMGGGIKSLRVVAHYACRNRNNQSGGKISEHARGRAIDIAAINLNNGTSLTVLSDWRTNRKGSVLKRMHKAACGPFGTVLGPNANRHHQDHFHFDTARYRSGTYCR